MNGFDRLEEEFDREVSPSCLFLRETSWGEQGYRAGGGGRRLVMSVLYPQYLVKSFKWANFKMAP